MSEIKESEERIKKLEERIKKLEKSNRNWRRKMPKIKKRNK